MRVGGWVVGVWECGSGEGHREIGAMHDSKPRYVTIVRLDDLGIASLVAFAALAGLSAGILL